MPSPHSKAPSNTPPSILCLFAFRIAFDHLLLDIYIHKSLVICRLCASAHCDLQRMRSHCQYTSPHQSSQFSIRCLHTAMQCKLRQAWWVIPFAGSNSIVQLQSVCDCADYAAASACFGAHSLPTYLNQLGRQSSRFNQASPSVKRPLTQPLHLGELGQLKNGMCW